MHFVWVLFGSKRIFTVIKLLLFVGTMAMKLNKSLHLVQVAGEHLQSDRKRKKRKDPLVNCKVIAVMSERLVQGKQRLSVFTVSVVLMHQCARFHH